MISGDAVPIPEHEPWMPPLDSRHRWRRWLSKLALRELVHRLHVERPRLLLALAQRLTARQ